MVREQLAAPPSVWCYLAEIGGYLLALPDDDRTVLLPYIGAIPQIAALPLALTPPYLLGLVNIAQRAEVLIDLARLFGQRDASLAQNQLEGRRMVVYGEGIASTQLPHRLAFAVDVGYELAQGTAQPGTVNHPLGTYVRQLISTKRGTAALLNMEIVCNRVLHDLGAPRLWNEPETRSEDADDAL